MGQQQLLLVILVTIIVGIATVVAINTFSSAADTANIDAVNQDIASIAAAAQGYYMKPEMMGGGGNSFDGIDFTKIANPGTIGSSTTIAYNANGTYSLSASGGTLTITADAASGSSYSEGSVGNTSGTASITVDVLKDGIDRDQNGTIDSEE
jgi:Tfp pilus assembly protein PilE